MRKHKLAVLFPGMGYTCEKPLLYYSGKMAASFGYEVLTVPYGSFLSGVKGKEEVFQIALTQAETILGGADFSDREILFVSKSIGTVVSAAYAQEHHLTVRSISYTPIEETFLYAGGEGIMFHGTADPIAECSERIRESCRKIGQQLFVIEGANHSLETGEVEKDIRNLQEIMKVVKAFI